MHSPASDAGRPFLFLAIALGWTWLFWWLAAFFAQPLGIGWIIPVSIGGIGPLLAALFVLYRYHDRSAQNAFWRRLFKVSQMRRRGLIIALLLAPALMLLAMFTDAAMTGAWRHTISPSLLSPPWAFLTLAIFLLLFGPVPEELGWRGYGQEYLQRRQSVLVAAIILGIVWALWHLPLFWIEGSYHARKGPFSIEFWRYSLGLIPHAILMAWVYNVAGRSILAAVLMHFMVNFVGEAIDSPDVVSWYRSFWELVLVAVVLVVWGRQLGLATPSPGTPRI